jgi:putative ABC transport system ATP-binding protein
MSTATTAAIHEDVRLPTDIDSAWKVLRRGLRESPELRAGLGFTLVLSLMVTAAQLVIPFLIQQILDRGIRGGFRPVFVYGLCAAAGALVAVVYLAARAAGRRLVGASEAALRTLRVRAFAHIHDLSVAEQTTEKRGVFVARVTADVDTLSEFTEWGGIAWILSFALVLGSLALMLVYSWQLTIPVVLLVAPLLVVLSRLQKGILGAFDHLRTRVGELLSEVSESLMGAAVVRAYGLEDRVDRRVKRAIRQRYSAQMTAYWRSTALFPIANLFSALAVAGVVAIGAHYGPGWGLSLGRVVAFLFLVDLFLQPLSDLPEIFSETQTAIAGWRKVLGVLDLPVEIAEPSPGATLPEGALAVEVDGVEFAYRGGGDPVLRGIDLELPAGAHVAIVGETGSGKTTFAKLLCRLADPTAGSIRIGGVGLREVAPASRRIAVRMVPQDGFLFDTTIWENVRSGLADATYADVVAAFASLGLETWVRSLPDGLDTRAGERGEGLSVGERQLVALTRAQIAEPGLLILDEATSAVDPGTERAIGEALRRLSQGRTTVTIAHRLSTAEGADLVLVFDDGRIVERGNHASLVAAGGSYASLYASWLGNVGTARRTGEL